MDKISKYALYKGQELIFLESIPHLEGDAQIIVCTCESKKKYYLKLDEWLQGVQDHRSYLESENIVTSESSTQQKVGLFRNLFRGRQDRYAHGFRRKDGGIGYALACEKEWALDCPKRQNARFKCLECAHRKFKAWGDKEVYEHLRGMKHNFSDVIGMYMMNVDSTVSVLVADFDKESWRIDALSYKQAAEAHGIDVALERSRSGNGAHAWIFFDDPVDAAEARRLGFLLIDEAMRGNPQLSFSSYDRLFPAQDTIAANGLGNLISLPLQGQAVQNANSVFIDDSFEPYQDQWRYLSKVGKLSEKKLVSVINSLMGTADQIDAFIVPDHDAAQRFRLDARSNLPRSSAKFVIEATKGNGLVIKRGGLPLKVQNDLRKLAVFANPEFYKAQNARRSVYGISRFIFCGEDTNDEILLPRGCEESLIRYAGENKIDLRMMDERNGEQILEVAFRGELQTAQQKAVNRLIEHESGILSAPTGFGKTVIGAYIISRLRAKTLVIVPRTSLLRQWQDSLERFLDIADNRAPLMTKSGNISKRKRPLIGQIGSGKRKISNLIDVATYQSLIKKNEDGIGEVSDLVRSYSLVICDECHHVGALNFEAVMKQVNAKWVYGLTATPKRADGLQKLIRLQCGPVRASISVREQIKNQSFERVMIPRFTSIRMPLMEVRDSFNEIMDRLCAHEFRNELIANDTAEAIKKGRMPLVITKRIDHARHLAKLIDNRGCRVVLLTGRGTAKEKARRLDGIKQIEGRFAIVATGGYIGEGFDFPALDTLIMASPYKWEGLITQYSGRLHREVEGKTDVLIYDYVDMNVPILERMYKNRMKTYGKLGYRIGTLEDSAESEPIFIRKDGAIELLGKDIAEAAYNIEISSSYLGPIHVQKLEAILRDAVQRGIKVRIISQKPKAEDSQIRFDGFVGRYRSLGCEVIATNGFCHNVVVIDEENCWYGTLPPLANGDVDDCSIRIKDANVAHEVKELIGDS